MSNREVGTVVHWNHSGGYGFIRPDMGGERDKFMHVSGLNGEEEPRIGDKFSYAISTDATGRTCAKKVRIATGDAQEDVREEREQVAADYHREEQTALADALRRAAEH